MKPGQVKDLGPISIVAIDVGNSKVAVGRWVEGRVYDTERVAISDRDAVIAALDRVRAKCENQQRQAIVIASVVEETTAWLKEHIDKTLELRPFVIGENTPLPIEVNLREPEQVGVDRVCAAAAAYHHTGQACTVVDIGSAVTVNVVDDKGVFQGGAIFAGLEMQSNALAGQTSALPRVEAAIPVSAVGKDTREAIQSGLCYGMAGAIRGIVERFATDANSWSQVIVTGGGAGLLREQLDFADNFVPDLCLIGVGLAYVRRIQEALGTVESQ